MTNISLITQKPKRKFFKKKKEIFFNSQTQLREYFSRTLSKRERPLRFNLTLKSL